MRLQKQQCENEIVKKTIESDETVGHAPESLLASSSAVCTGEPKYVPEGTWVLKVEFKYSVFTRSMAAAKGRSNILEQSPKKAS